MSPIKRSFFSFFRRHKISGIFLVVFLAVIGVIGFLHTPPARKYVFNRLQNMLESQYGLQLQADSFRYNLFTLCVSMDRLSLDGEESEFPLERFSADYIRVDIGIRTIVSRMLHFQNIKIDNPDLILRSPPLDGAGGNSRSPAGPLEIEVDKLNISRGNIKFKDQLTPLQAALAQVKIHIRFDKAEKHHIALFSAEKGELDYQGNKLLIDHIHFPFLFEKNTLQLQDFQLESPALTLNVTGNIHDFQTSPEFDVLFSADIRSDVLSEVFSDIPLLQGVVHLNARLYSTLEDPGLEASLTTENLTAAGVPVSSARTEISYHAARLSLNHFTVQSPWGKLNGEGVWFLEEEETSQITLTWNELKLDPFLSRFSLPMTIHTESRGQIQGEWTKLDLSHLKASLEANFDSYPHPERRADISGRIKADWAEGNALVHPSQIAFPGGTLQFQGNLDADRQGRARLNFNIEEFSRIVPHLPQEWDLASLKGALNGTAVFQGTWLHPRAALELFSPGISYRDLSFSRLQADLGYQNQTLSIHEGLILAEEGEIHFSGEIAAPLPELSTDGFSSLNLSVAGLSLEPVFGAFFPSLPVEGILEGKSSLTGSLQNPRVDIKLNASSVKIGEENIESFSLQGTYQADQISLSQMEIIKNGARLSGSGKWNPGPETFILDVNGRGIRIEDFALLPPEFQSYSGDIDFQINAQGPLRQPEGLLKLQLGKAKAGEIRIGEWLLEARADGKNLSAHLHTKDKIIQVQAEMPLASPRRIQTRIEINGLDLGSYFPSKPGTQGPMPSFSTHIAAEADFLIPLEDPQYLSGRFHMDSLRFAYRGHQFTLPQSISLSAGDGLISIQNLIVSGPQTEIRAGGSIPVSGDPQTGLFLSGTINLHAFEPFIPGSRLSGMVDLNTSAAGTLQNPDLGGIIRLEKAEAGYNGLPYTLEKMRAEITLASGWIQLKNFSARTGDGKIEAEGQFQIPGLNSRSAKNMNDRFSVQWEGLSPAPLNAFLPPEYSGKLDGEISGNVTAAGDFSNPDAVSLDGRISRLRIKLDPFLMEEEEDILFSLSQKRLYLKSFHLAGSRSSIQAQGSLDLAQKEPYIQGSLVVSLDGGSLSPLVDSVLLSGKTILDLSFQGPAHHPSITGTGSIRDGYIQLQDLPLTISDLQGEMDFSESRFEISSLNASANGGPVSLTGKVEYSQFNPEQVQLDLNFSRLQWNHPEGLHSLNRGDLQLLYSGEEWEFSGEVRIRQAYFKKDIFIGTELVNQIRLSRVRMQSEMPDFLRRLNMDLRITTDGEAVIDNNLAELGLNANLVLKGTPVDPVLSGLISNPFPGKIFLGERLFQVETVRMDFPGGDVLDGRINITAHTTVSDKYEQINIQLAVTGPVTDISTSLTSVPARSQGELASLLITGGGIEGLRSETANIIGNQLLLYFTSPLASPVTRQIENLLKAEDVRIEPINIATEEDPGARFTFRKGLIKNVDLIYSADITNTQAQTWILEYSLTRNFTLRAYHKDDGSYGSGLEHRFGLGKPDYDEGPGPSEKSRNILEQVRFSGDLGFPEEQLRSHIRVLRTGEVFNIGDLQSASEKLEQYYKKRNYLNTVITPRILYGERGNVQIDIHIDAGEPVFLNFQGDPVSKGAMKKIIDSWNGRLPESARISEASQQILNRTRGEGYIQAEVNHEKEILTGGIRHTFRIHKGIRFETGTFLIEGGNAVPKEEIRKAIKNIPAAQSTGLWNLLQNFGRVQKQLEKLYEEKGYLQVRIHPPQTEINRAARKVNILLPIDQGKQSRAEGLHFDGLESFSPEFLQKSLAVVPGQVFTPSKLAADINRLIDHYRSRGFQNVKVSADLQYRNEKTGVDLTYIISEGIIYNIQEVVISGNRRTPDKVIRRELVFKEGEPVVPSALVESQKNLYDLNIFDLVSIQRKTLPDEPGNEQIQVEVREMPLFYLGYGLRYNSEDKLGGFGNIEFNNLFGRSRNGILFYRQNKWEKNFRFTLTDPYFFGLPINTLHSFHLTREERAGLVNDEIGYTAEQRLTLPFSFSLSYLYRLNHIHTYELDSQGPFTYDFNWWFSELSTYLVRDTRSDKLNAVTGSFFSLSLTYSPEFLGSTFTYIRIFGQYSFFQPLSGKLIWASNVRLGIGNAFEQVMIPSKRFYAGGGNSIRGFEKDQVGPYNRFLDRPNGGEGLFILNQELRFPLFHWLSGVVFFDAGNVYRNFEDFKPWELRTSTGMGLRLDTPVGLLRLDYGINLSPEEREPHAVLFFSLGQAF
ncbi:MAG: translocation/assembly module TamB domain-containing protein [Candidatus Aminicenantes bacterium]